MLGPTRSMPSLRWLAACLSLFVAAGCMGIPRPPKIGEADPTPIVTAAPSSADTATPRPSATAPPADAAPVTGVWWVRKILSAKDRSALIPGKAFEDQAFYVTAGCAREPCSTVEVKMTPFGRSSPVTVAVLDREGDDYVSAARLENEGPCLNDAGDRVPGGATARSTMRLRAANVRVAGTAVETPRLMGSLTLDLAPTPIGTAAGCGPLTASYELSGELVSVAGSTDEPVEPDQPPNTAGGVVNLASIGVKVPGVKIEYFAIQGDTVDELISDLARGGVRACGEINYEWNEGDDRPAACAITGFNDLDAAMDQEVDSGGACTISRAEVKPRFTIHMPRWTAPKKVPKRLLAWWRDVVVFIRDHEAGHVRISRAHVKTLNADLLGAPCRSATSIIRKWAAALSAAHEEYDRVEYAKPWPLPPFGY